MKSGEVQGALSGLALVFAAACSEDSVADEAQDVCNSLESLDETVSQVAGTHVDLTSTWVGDVQDALGQVQSAVQDVQDAGSGLADAVKSTLQGALDDYPSALQDIPADDTLAEAGDVVASAQAGFAQAWSDTISQLECSASTPSS